MVYGLRNTGNTCYLNSTVQALRATLRQVPDELRDLFQRMGVKETDCSALQSTLAKEYPPIGTREQQDAQELLTILLDTIACNDVMGELTSTVACSCGSRNETVEKFSHLSLPLKRSVNDSFESFLEKETIRMTCDKCETDQACTLSSRITSWPASLIIHLKRFAYGEEHQETFPRRASSPLRRTTERLSTRAGPSEHATAADAPADEQMNTMDATTRSLVSPPTSSMVSNEAEPIPCTQDPPRYHNGTSLSASIVPTQANHTSMGISTFGHVSPTGTFVDLADEFLLGTEDDAHKTLALPCKVSESPLLPLLASYTEWSAQEAILQLLVRLMVNIPQGDKFRSLRGDSKALSVFPTPSARLYALRTLQWSYEATTNRFTYPVEKTGDVGIMVDALHALGTYVKQAHLRRERDAAIVAFKESRLPTGGPPIKSWGKIPGGNRRGTVRNSYAGALSRKLEYPTTVPFEWHVRSGEGLAPYQLVAVVIHIGPSLHSGHYIALCRVEDRWVRCNDSVVSTVLLDDVRREATAGYLFFYRR